MTASTAALNPSCVEVDRAECGAVEPPAGGVSPNPVLTAVALTVYEPEALAPVEGAEVVVYQVHPGGGSEWEVASGVTDEKGEFHFTEDLLQYAVAGSYSAGSLKFVARYGGAEATQTVRALGAGTPPQWVVVCPPGTKAVTCEVAKAQALWKTTYEQQLRAWNYESSGRPPQIASFAADMAHTVVLNEALPSDSRLASHWIDTYSWWVGDLGIPPKDWDALLDRFAQTWALFTAIPFPEYPGFPDLFQRCAKGVTLAQGKDGANYAVASPRLYSSTWSDYFPRKDEKIRKDMAAAYLIAIFSIYRCMEHRIKQKVKETQRTQRTMGILSFAVTGMLSPMLVAAGPSGVAVLGTETYQFVAQQFGPGVEAMGVTAALAAGLLAAGDTTLVVKALAPAIEEELDAMDPAAAAAVRAVYPQLVDIAGDAVTGPAGVGTGAQDFASLQGLGGVMAAMMIKAIASIPKMYAANRIEELGDVARGAQAAADDVYAFVEGRGVSPELAAFLQWVVDTLKLRDLFDLSIEEFLDQIQKALDVANEHGGKITIVPQDGGGGVDIVPTNADGVPIDADGNPLTGGTTSRTEPVPQKPQTELYAAVGVGGAALMTVVATGLL